MTDHDKTARELLDSLLHYVGRADHYPDEYAKVAAALARAEAEGARRGVEQERARCVRVADYFFNYWPNSDEPRAKEWARAALVILNAIERGKFCAEEPKAAAPPEPAPSRAGEAGESDNKAWRLAKEAIGASWPSLPLDLRDRIVDYFKPAPPPPVEPKPEAATCGYVTDLRECGKPATTTDRTGLYPSCAEHATDSPAKPEAALYTLHDAPSPSQPACGIPARLDMTAQPEAATVPLPAATPTLYGDDARRLLDDLLRGVGDKEMARRSAAAAKELARVTAKPEAGARCVFCDGAREVPATGGDGAGVGGMMDCPECTPPSPPREEANRAPWPDDAVDGVAKLGTKIATMGAELARLRRERARLVEAARAVLELRIIRRGDKACAALEALRAAVEGVGK